MNLHNFQINAKFLAATVEIRGEDPSERLKGSTWKLRQMVQVPYPEPPHSFPDPVVAHPVLRVVKVPYPQPEHSLQNSQGMDSQEPSRESDPRSHPVWSLGTWNPSLMPPNWRRVITQATIKIISSRIQSDPSRPDRVPVTAPVNAPG
jgi:hypothetical protein